MFKFDIQFRCHPCPTLKLDNKISFKMSQPEVALIQNIVQFIVILDEKMPIFFFSTYIPYIYICM